MGRGKVELKRIEKTSNRQVTFSKRRIGLLKKANELAVLCAADVAVIVHSNKGKLYEYSSKRMENILLRYNGVSGSSDVTTEVNDGPQPQVKALKYEFEMLRRMRTRLVLGKKYRDLSSNNDWKPFESLLNEVTSAINEQKEQTLLGKLEESRLKEEKTVLENQTLRQEIQRLKQELSLKKDLVDPDTTLTLGLPGTTSQKLITPDVENDVENLMQME